jgi:hypothetical protein
MQYRWAISMDHLPSKIKIHAARAILPMRQKGCHYMKKLFCFWMMAAMPSGTAGDEHLVNRA